MFDGYAALSGALSADTTGANADKSGQAVSAFAGATVRGVVVRLWEAATCADATPAHGYLSRRGCWPGRHDGRDAKRAGDDYRKATDGE